LLLGLDAVVVVVKSLQYSKTFGEKMKRKVWDTSSPVPYTRDGSTLSFCASPKNSEMLSTAWEHSTIALQPKNELFPPKNSEMLSTAPEHSTIGLQPKNELFLSSTDSVKGTEHFLILVSKMAGSMSSTVSVLVFFFEIGLLGH
jgi:hypothetical protein